jgi:hypothetical protein
MKHYLGLSLLLVTFAAVTVAGLYSCARLADRTVDHVRSAFAQVLSLQPQVTINQRIILTQTVPVAELAVVSKEALITAGFSQHFEVLSYEVPLTEKSLKVEATYRFKAGFDLRQPFRVEINPLTHAIQAHFPPAKILSVERVGDMTFQGEDSALNRLTDVERQKALNDLDAVARDAAEKSGLKEDAEKQVQERLTQIFAHNGERFDALWDKSSYPLIEKP